MGEIRGEGLMASDRLAELLRLRSELSEEEISHMTESSAWQWIHANASAPDEMSNDFRDLKNV